MILTWSRGTIFEFCDEISILFVTLVLYNFSSFKKKEKEVKTHNIQCFLVAITLFYFV